MNIIGLNNEMYISSACLLKNEEITFAIAEERITRNKHTKKFPLNAINECLKNTNTNIDEINYFVNSWNPAIYFQKFNPLYSSNRRHLVEQLYSVPDHLLSLYDRPKIDYIEQKFYFNNKCIPIYYIDHHNAHAANGYFQSNFKNAAILVADSQGEYDSTVFYQAKENKIEKLRSFKYPQSIGLFYAVFTEYLGFKANSDEWKVMALSSYNTYKNKYYKLIKENIVKLFNDGSFELDLTYFNSFIHEQPLSFTKKMIDLLGNSRNKNEPLEKRHYEIASAMQKISEEIITNMLNWLYKETKELNLVLSGGFFMNSVFNAKVKKLSKFKNLYISSAPDDSGNAIGSALYLYHHILEQPRNYEKLPIQTNYLGNFYSNLEIKTILDKYNLKYEFFDKIECEAAKELKNNKIIGWFQGKMEFGQRALGNRSILANPMIEETKSNVNLAIKYRENFRPFAPAVLKEFQNDYFESDESIFFMEKVVKVKQEKKEKIPAVVHVDDSCRVQTVTKENNELFYNLIEHFFKLTNVPVVLNTSFNLNNEPIVRTPDDAIRSFMTCGMDFLFIGNYKISK